MSCRVMNRRLRNWPRFVKRLSEDALEYRLLRTWRTIYINIFKRKYGERKDNIMDNLNIPEVAK